MLFVYFYKKFYFKGMSKINTAEKKNSNNRRSCRRLCLICCSQKFVENVFSNIAPVSPILLVINLKGHSVLLLFIFFMTTRRYVSK